MQNFLLLTVVLAAFLFGWLFMKEVDVFLEKMAVQKLNIIFLPKRVDIPTDKNYNSKKVMMMFPSAIHKS